jgi:drug/metabolite transporter (DMT)-like permease
VLSSGSIGGDLSPIYILSAVLGVLCIGESTVVIKGFPRAHPIPTNAVAMATGALLLIGASLLLGDEWTMPTRAQTWTALAWLVIAGSVALFVLYLFLIARWSASATNYVITLMPIVAVTLGALIADESISVEVVLGGLLVLSAVYVALGKERPPREETVLPAVPEAAPEIST